MAGHNLQHALTRENLPDRVKAQSIDFRELTLDKMTVIPLQLRKRFEKLEKLQQSQLDAAAKAETVKNFCCPNEECSQYGVLGGGNIRVRAKNKRNHIRLLECRVCGQQFSERCGTILNNARIDPQKIVAILEYLGEGKSQREIARLTCVDRGAVSRYVKLTGGHVQEFHDELVAFLSEKQTVGRRKIG